MIDIVYVILLIIAIVKGIRKGLIVAVFAILSYIIGIAAALKLSALVAEYLQKSINVSGKWLPVISFALVFLVVVILVNWGGKLIQKTFEMAFLGWANKIAGAAVYAALYTIIFSIFLFFAEKIQLLQPGAIQQSITYGFVKPWGPAVIDNFGKIIPIFKNSFASLGDFFEGVSNKIQH